MSTQPCVKCGNPLEQGARFCGGCGTQQPGAVIPQAAVRTGAKTMFQGGGSTPTPAAKPSGNVAFDATIAPGQKPITSPAAQQARPAPAPQPAAKAAPVVRGPAPDFEGDLTGKTLNNRYLIEGKLGEGGFGAVYKAKQLQMGRTVALKVLHARMAKDQQVIGRFKREAQASSLLRAPHTVQVYDFDQSPEGTMYLAMEMLQGKSLHSVLREGAMEVVRCAKVLDGIADSLGEAHGQGIVHRDIKPENIYLEPRPTPDFVKVLDFGIAKIVSGDGLSQAGPALTAAGQTLGTLEYMSPEQLMGAQLDGRSDLYALGILAYEMLVGALPFPAKTPGELITAHLKTMPPPPSKVKPGIPPLMDQIVLRLLEKQRDKRYANTDDLRKDLARVASGEQGVAVAAAAPAPAPVPAARPAAVAAKPVANPQTERVAPVPGKKSMMPLIIGVAVVVVAIVGGLIFWASR